MQTCLACHSVRPHVDWRRTSEGPKSRCLEPRAFLGATGFLSHSSAFQEHADGVSSLEHLGSLKNKPGDLLNKAVLSCDTPRKCLESCPSTGFMATMEFGECKAKCQRLLAASIGFLFVCRRST